MSLQLPDINPVIFAIGPVAVRWYALAYVMGIVLGWLYLGRLLRKEPLWAPRTAPVTSEQLDDLILWITLGIILGGRIGYILAYDTSVIWEHPLEIFQVWNGGMSFHGGFTGVVIATILYCRRQKFDMAQMLNLGDLLASAAPIGLFFGRIANFINGELWGRPTDLPWGMDFCNKYIMRQYRGTCPADPDGIPIFRHPSQLYEAALEGLLLFGLMWFLSHRLGKLKQPGLIMGTFIAGYGLIRILLENLRNPDAQMTGFQVITMGMLLSLPMVAAGGYFIWNALRSKPVDAA
jgi:phosphatidylglycerol:prolipoprotein diacylglycerol transferase